MIFVVDTGAARQALAGRLLRCPQDGCGGVLRPWASARARRICLPGGGSAELRPDRARCVACGRTQVLLPAWYLPRRASSIGVIGAALLAKAGGLGHRPIAARLQVPAATVRDWLRSLTHGAPAPAPAATPTSSNAVLPPTPAQPPPPAPTPQTTR